MHAVLRVLLLALVELSAVLTLRAQAAEALPPIFAPRSTPIGAVASPSPRTLTPMVSDRIRNGLNETAGRLLAEVKVFDGPVTPDPANRPGAFASDTAVLMDQFVVKSSSLRLAKLPPVDPGLLKFLRTGTLYHKLHGNVEVEVYLNIMTVGQVGGLDRGREFTRLELAFSFSW